MRQNRNSVLVLSLFLTTLPAALAADPPVPSPNILDMAQRQVTAYLAKLADVHCTESVTQEKLSEKGHVQATERAKYDYLIMMSGNGDDFQLSESRIESSASHRKALPMLVSNGAATVLLVFHPYYRNSFTFKLGAEETVDGKAAVPVHFAHIAGRRTPAALALRGREYPLELEGTAWLDPHTGEVIKIDASLQHDMSDLGLRSMHILVDYKPVTLDKTAADMPAMAVVDVTTPLQHWRNTHTFDDYKSFSTDAEQDPGVTIHAENNGAAKETTASVAAINSKEKP